MRVEGSLIRSISTQAGPNVANSRLLATKRSGTLLQESPGRCLIANWRLVRTNAAGYAYSPLTGRMLAWYEDALDSFSSGNRLWPTPRVRTTVWLCKGNAWLKILGDSSILRTSQQMIQAAATASKMLASHPSAFGGLLCSGNAYSVLLSLPPFDSVQD